MKKVIMIILMAACIAVPAAAKNKQRMVEGSGSDRSPVVERDENRAFDLSAHDKITIQTFYRQRAHREREGEASEKSPGDQHKPLPPGLQKKVARGGSLPPGWQKKLERGDVMSLEDYQHAAPIPQSLSDALPPQPEGTELVKAEDRIFRILETTREILDVFDVRY